MDKALAIAKTTLKEYGAYRLSFVLWRLRMFISLMITFFLWYAATDAGNTFGSYSKTGILTYILAANLIGAFVMGTRTMEIAGEINDGSIINYLLKPVPFFHYAFARDVADKLINASFAVFEVCLVALAFRIPLSVPHQPFLGLLLLANGTLISFCIGLLLSFIGFWTTEVWAPRFLFIMIVFFLSGSYFPLDLLPKQIYAILLLTPFPYLYYLPTKIMLGTLGTLPVAEIALSFVWVVVTYKAATAVWMRGNKSFSFWGK